MTFSHRSTGFKIGEAFADELDRVRVTVDDATVRVVGAKYKLFSELTPPNERGERWYALRYTRLGILGEPGGPTIEEIRIARDIRAELRAEEDRQKQEFAALTQVKPTPALTRGNDDLHHWRRAVGGVAVLGRSQAAGGDRRSEAGCAAGEDRRSEAQRLYRRLALEHVTENASAPARGRWRAVVTGYGEPRRSFTSTRPVRSPTTLGRSRWKIRSMTLAGKIAGALGGSSGPDVNGNYLCHCPAHADENPFALDLRPRRRVVGSLLRRLATGLGRLRREVSPRA